MDTRTAPTGPTRRTVLTSTAFAVPAIAMTVSTPAFAATGAQTMTISSPNMQAIAKGDTPITVNVTDNNGQPVNSGVVSLTGPSGVSFSPANPTISNGTATSTMTTTDNWATPGSTLTITGTTSGGNTNAGLTILGANALAVGGNGTTGSSGNYQGTGAAGTGSPTDLAITPPTQLLLTFPSPIVALQSGKGQSYGFSVAVLQDGTAWAVGDNSYGQLGDGTTTTRTTWAKIPALSNVVQVSIADEVAFALLGNGEVRAWGRNNRGQLGNGTTTDSLTPVAVQGITNATQIACSSLNGYALLASGQVRSWGYGGAGGLGNGDTSGQDKTTPVAVTGVTSATQITGGQAAAYALLSSGEIRAWGNGNSYGELGNGANGLRYAPVPVSGISNAVEISAFRYGAVARLSTGEVRAWGYGALGTLGNGGTANSNAPVAVSGISTATKIATSNLSAFAKLSSGDYVGWGSNRLSQLNDGTTTDRNTPVTFNDTANVKAILSSPKGGTIFLLRKDQ